MYELIRIVMVNVNFNHHHRYPVLAISNYCRLLVGQMEMAAVDRPDSRP